MLDQVYQVNCINQIVVIIKLNVVAFHTDLILKYDHDQMRNRRI